MKNAHSRFSGPDKAQILPVSNLRVFRAGTRVCIGLGRLLQYTIVCHRGHLLGLGNFLSSRRVDSPLQLVSQFIVDVEDLLPLVVIPVGHSRALTVEISGAQWDEGKKEEEGHSSGRGTEDSSVQIPEEDDDG